MVAFLIYKWRRRNLSMYDAIEDFLQSHNNLMPIRYSYPEIRKIPNGFIEKLGEGGYGSVFKGKLQSGHLVAIKMLDKSRPTAKNLLVKLQQSEGFTTQILCNSLAFVLRDQSVLLYMNSCLMVLSTNTFFLKKEVSP